MMHLVTGASASGKSAYAEDLLVLAKSAEKYYIATMRPWGAEGAARVKKHRAMREGNPGPDPTGHSEFKGTDRRSDHRDERDFFRRMPL